MQEEIKTDNFEKFMDDYTNKYIHVCIENNSIDSKLFDKYGVKRGLRDKNGKGVLSGITNISLIKATDMVDNHIVPCEGQLYYRGYNIYDLVNDKLYYDTGRESTISARCGNMDGEITSTVDETEIPTEDNQSNFGSGFGYQYGPDDTIEIYINEKWLVFKYREESE